MRGLRANLKAGVLARGSEDYLLQLGPGLFRGTGSSDSGSSDGATQICDLARPAEPQQSGKRRAGLDRLAKWHGLNLRPCQNFCMLRMMIIMCRVVQRAVL